MARFDLSGDGWAVIESLLIRDGLARCAKASFMFFGRAYRGGFCWDIFEALAPASKDALVFVRRSIVKAHRSSSGVQTLDGKAFDTSLDREIPPFVIVSDKA